MKTRIFSVLILSLGLLAATTGCGNPGSDAPGTGPAPEDDYELRFTSPKHQLFLEKLFEDCMTLTDDERYRAQDPSMSRQEVEGYCLCFRMMFREQFTEAELDAYLDKDQPLDESRLDDIAASCSIHLEE